MREEFLSGQKTPAKKFYGSKGRNLLTWKNAKTAFFPYIVMLLMNIKSILVICQELFEKDFDMFFGKKGNF
ncbi:MAG: hypothetical protein K1W23_13280, partial [Lachnospiraceae bacterium]